MWNILYELSSILLNSTLLCPKKVKNINENTYKRWRIWKTPKKSLQTLAWFLTSTKTPSLKILVFLTNVFIYLFVSNIYLYSSKKNIDNVILRHMNKFSTHILFIHYTFLPNIIHNSFSLSFICRYIYTAYIMHLVFIWLLHLLNTYSDFRFYFHYLYIFTTTTKKHIR